MKYIKIVAYVIVSLTVFAGARQLIRGNTYASLVDDNSISIDYECKVRKLTVSPILDTSNTDVAEIILAVRGLTEAMPNTESVNGYWSDEDVATYEVPAWSLYELPSGQKGADFYKPTILGIKDLGPDVRAIKLAWSGYDPATGEIITRAVYNLLAQKYGSTWKFVRETSRYTAHWSKETEDLVTYCVSPRKEFSRTEAKEFNKILNRYADFFQIDLFPITYYDCVDAVEMYRVLGFDFHVTPMKFEISGMASPGDIIYSGRNNASYGHEAVHLFTSKIRRNSNRFLDEGLAMLLDGSGGRPYSWHRDKLRVWLEDTPRDLMRYTDPYEGTYIDRDTSVGYAVGALVCEYIIAEYGRSKLFELLRTVDSTERLFEEIELDRGRLTAVLVEMLSHELAGDGFAE